VIPFLLVILLYTFQFEIKKYKLSLALLTETVFCSFQIKEQERKAIEDQNPAISLAKRRRKMIACLPKLFNVIHYLIQSIRRWVITKEELVHKIIAGHSDITDRSKPSNH